MPKLNTEGMTQSGLAALEQLKKVRPGRTVVLFDRHDEEWMLSERELAALKPVMYADKDGNEFRASDVDAARKRGAKNSIRFEYDDFGTGTLHEDGTLTIGCQSHKLSVWKRGNDAIRSYMGPGIDPWNPRPDRYKDAEVLIPILEKKLAQLKAKKAA
jgi:hypothetical protein